MPVDIDRDRSDRSVLNLVVEAILAKQFLQLTAALGYLKPAVFAWFDIVVAGDIVGAVGGQDDGRPVARTLSPGWDRRWR